MNLWQALKMAYKSISQKKMRSFLTMLGIIIGVASVVIMVSVVQGLNKKSMEFFEKMGDNKIDVSAYSYNDMGNEISQKLYDYCLSMGDVVLGITPDAEVYETISVKYGAKTVTINDNSGGYGGGMWMGGAGFSMAYNEDDWQKRCSMKLGSDQYGVCNNYTLANGRELSYLDIEKENQVCVLGAGAKEQLFDYTDPVGETITLNGQPFLVVGWYESMNVEYWPELDNVFVIPYTLNRTMNKNQSISRYAVKAKSSQATIEAMTRLSAYLEGLFPLNADGYCETGSFNVSSNNSYAQDMESQSLMQSLVLGAIAGVSLLVGGIGIMNIMLVTVSERTREIGIRKAIGAERKSIIAQFLIEAAMLCGIGGVIGIGIGYLGTMIAGKVILGNLSLVPSSGIVVGAFGFSVALGIAFGLFPAIKASGLQPVVALRAD